MSSKHELSVCAGCIVKGKLFLLWYSKCNFIKVLYPFIYLSVILFYIANTLTAYNWPRCIHFQWNYKKNFFLILTIASLDVFALIQCYLLPGALNKDFLIISNLFIPHTVSIYHYACMSFSFLWGEAFIHTLIHTEMTQKIDP